MSDIAYSENFLSSTSQVATGIFSDNTQELLPVVGSHSVLDQFVQQIQSIFPFLEWTSQVEVWGFLAMVILWIFAVIWTLRDAMARSESLGFQFFSALLVALLSPVIGLPLYLAIRPLTYKWERGYWKEVLQANAIFCPHCENLVNPQHKACVYLWRGFENKL